MKKHLYFCLLAVILILSSCSKKAETVVIDLQDTTVAIDVPYTASVTYQVADTAPRFGCSPNDSVRGPKLKHPKVTGYHNDTATATGVVKVVLNDSMAKANDLRIVKAGTGSQKSVNLPNDGNTSSAGVMFGNVCLPWWLFALILIFLLLLGLLMSGSRRNDARSHSDYQSVPTQPDPGLISRLDKMDTNHNVMSSELKALKDQVSNLQKPLSSDETRKIVAEEIGKSADDLKVYLKEQQSLSIMIAGSVAAAAEMMKSKADKDNRREITHHSKIDGKKYRVILRKDPDGSVHYEIFDGDTMLYSNTVEYKKEAA